MAFLGEDDVEDGMGAVVGFVYVRSCYGFGGIEVIGGYSLF